MSSPRLNQNGSKMMDATLKMADSLYPISHSLSPFRLGLVAVAVMAFGWMVAATYADVRFTENFNYSGLISTNGWSIISGTNTNPRSASGSSLTYPDSTVSGIGSSLVLTNTGEDYAKNMSSAISSGAVYSSFLVNLSEAKTGDAFYLLGSSSTAWFVRIAAKSTNTGFVFGVGKNSTYTYETTQRNLNTTYQVVVKYTYNASAADDVISLWVNPVLGGTEASSTPVLSGIGAAIADATTLDRVILRQGSSTAAPTLTIDGILVGSTWSDVASSSTVLTPTINAAGTLSSFTTAVGTASAAQTFSVTGTNLTANITVTAPTGFQVASDGATFGSTATITQSGGSASGTVSVRVANNASLGNIAGNVTLASTTASGSVPVSAFVSGPVAVPYGPETFETSQGQWYAYSVAGTANWTRTSVTTPSADSFMQMNGLGSDVAANDWLILGPMDLTSVTTPVVEFASEKAFSTNVADELTLKVSSNYAGTGDPSSATWTSLSFTKPSVDNVSVNSGQVVLEGMGGQSSVYVAFHYVGGGTLTGSTARWRVDDVQVYAMTTPALGLSLSGYTVTEGGTLIGVVSVPVAPLTDLVVTVTSLDSTEILVDGLGGAGTTSTTVTIPAGATSASFNIDAPTDSIIDGNIGNVQITAEAAGYTSGSILIATVFDSDYVLPTVVVNKFENGTPDKIELIVVGNGIPGSIVDLQGMILKDHSSSNANDTGGRYTFATNPLWAAVPAGTIIVLTLDNTATDPNQDNFIIQVGLNNTTYFTKGANTMDVAGTEMIMIKAAGSSDAGSAGQIHALANGSATAAQTAAAGMPKLVADVGAAGVVYATNPNGVLADYNGAGVALGAKTFGAANNTPNASFLATLRGTSEISMSAASITLLDKANDPGQSTTVTLTMLPSPTADTVVTLSSDQTSRLTLPATVTVLANTAEITFTATATADGVDSGTVTASVTAQASGYNNGLLQINVVDTDYSTPPVVINEYANAAPSDFVELMVVQDRLDMRGMILKDFSGTVASADGGGRSTFTSNALWSSVRAGTLIVITSDTAATEDLDPDDFLLVVKRNNTLYFTNTGSFDIATTDMLMIKAAGAPLDGVNGSLHALAGGDPAGLYFNLAPWPKVITSTGSGSATSVQLLTPTSSAADLNGSAAGLAIGGVATPTSGAGNGIANTSYIDGLKPASSLQAPEITSLPTGSVQQGSLFSYTITANNNAGGTFGATGLPTGLSLDAATGVISGTVATTGTYVISLSATNADWVGVGILTLTVSQAPPVITSATTASGTVGAAFTYQITASYFPTAYGATGLPGGLLINTATGLISGTPTQGGTFTVGLTASNSAGSGSATLTLTIPVPNSAPTDIGLTAASIAENNAVNANVGTLSTTDTDSSDTHTYALVAGTGDTDNGSFNISGTWLRASGAFDFETKSSYSIRVRTTDSANNTFEKVFAITVTDVAEGGSTFSSWSGGGVLDSANVGKYAIGGASSLSATDGVAPSSAVSGGNLVLTAIVRTDDPKLTVAGEVVGSLTDYATPGSISTVNGVDTADQTGVTAGCKRQTFTVSQGADTKKFLRLKATLQP